jgi:hypothetical protein
MTDQLEATSRIVLDVLAMAIDARRTQGGALEREARSIACQLERIHSLRDAEATIRRAFISSFANPEPFAEHEVALAGRLLWLRLRAERLVARTPDVEGYSAEEILDLVGSDLRDTVFSGKPIVFHVGSAQVLGTFRLVPGQVVAELAHIDGGGEGVLLFLSNLLRQFGRQNHITSILWIVHALTCAAPNTRLRALLERRGFARSDHNGRPTLQLTETLDAG